MLVRKALFAIVALLSCNSQGLASDMPWDYISSNKKNLFLDTVVEACIKKTKELKKSNIKIVHFKNFVNIFLINQDEISSFKGRQFYTYMAEKIKKCDLFSISNESMEIYLECLIKNGQILPLSLNTERFYVRPNSELDKAYEKYLNGQEKSKHLKRKLNLCDEENPSSLKTAKNIFSVRHQVYVSQAVQTYHNMEFDKENINEMEENEPILTLHFLTVALPYYLDYTNFGEDVFFSDVFVRLYGRDINLDLGFVDESDQIVNMELQAELLHDFFWDYKEFIEPEQKDADAIVL